MKQYGMLGQLTLVNKDKCDPARVPLVNKGRIVNITLTREGNPAGLKPTLVNKRINSSHIKNFSAPAPHPTVPLDSQTCYFKMMCVDYIDDKSIFKTTMIKSIEESPSNRQLHFKKLDVLDYHVEFYHLTKKHSVYESKGLNRTIVGFEIKLLRKYGKYIIYYYIPSGLIAIISCVSILYDLIFFFA